MISFRQPCDYIHKGRVVWCNPSDVVTIKPGDRYDWCVITLRNGDSFTADLSQDQAAIKINKALEEDKR